MSDEWIIGNKIPHIDGQEFEVQLMGDFVRRAARNPNRDPSTLWFLDCTYPWQNVICNDEYIKAWRIKTTSALPSAKSEDLAD